MLMCVHLFLLQVNPIVRRTTLTMFPVCFLLPTNKQREEKIREGKGTVDSSREGLDRHCRSQEQMEEQEQEQMEQQEQEQREQHEQEQIEQQEQEQTEEVQQADHIRAREEEAAEALLSMTEAGVTRKTSTDRGGSDEAGANIGGREH